MIVSWLILTGTAYDDFGFLRCFDCRPAACQLERFGQNWGQQTNWHVAFDFGARVFGLCLILFLPVPQGEVWVWVLVSGIIHMFYQLFLGFACERGDLSRVHPIARGGALIIVLLISLMFGIDALGGFDFLGILVLCLGIVMMARGVFSSGEDRKLIPVAMGSACATAGYSLVDGLGARIMGDALAYVTWLLIFAALFYRPIILVLRGALFCHEMTNKSR